MRFIDALLGEHAVFYAQFDRLEAELPHTHSATEIREQAGLLASALVTHAKLEDELLFVPMAKAGGDAGLLQVMEEEHEQIALGLDRAQGTNDVERARTELLAAVSLAREHFAREERLTFPLAASLLGVDALRESGGAWAERRRVHLS
jgi:hypothetical protein